MIIVIDWNSLRPSDPIASFVIGWRQCLRVGGKFLISLHCIIWLWFNPAPIFVQIICIFLAEQEKKMHELFTTYKFWSKIRGWCEINANLTVLPQSLASVMKTSPDSWRRFLWDSFKTCRCLGNAMQIPMQMAKAFLSATFFYFMLKWIDQYNKHSVGKCLKCHILQTMSWREIQNQHGKLSSGFLFLFLCVFSLFFFIAVCEA